MPAESSLAERAHFDGTWTRYGGVAWESPAAEWLAAQTRTSPRGLLCYQHWAASPSDPMVTDRSVDERFFFVGESVFEYAARSDPPERFRFLAGEYVFFPTLGMVTTAPAAGIDDDGTLDRDALAAMAAAATVVIVAAWDAEALVLWQGAEPG